MNIGDMRHRVQFQRALLVDDGFAEVENFSNHGTEISCQKVDANDGERWRAGEVSSQITARFVVRYSTFTADITTKDRLVCGGVTYNIVGKKEVGNHRAWFEITAAARSD